MEWPWIMFKNSRRAGRCMHNFWATNDWAYLLRIQVCLYLRCNCIPLNYFSDRFTVAACYGWLKSPGMASVGLKIEIHEIRRNWRNPVSINRNPPSATNSTPMKRKLIIERKQPRNQRLPRNPVLLAKSTHSHTFSGEHLTRMLQFKLEATSIALIRPTVRRQRVSNNVGG